MVETTRRQRRSRGLAHVLSTSTASYGSEMKKFTIRSKHPCLGETNANCALRQYRRHRLRWFHESKVNWGGISCLRLFCPSALWQPSGRTEWTTIPLHSLASIYLGVSPLFCPGCAWQISSPSHEASRWESCNPLVQTEGVTRRKSIREKQGVTLNSSMNLVKVIMNFRL